MIKKIGLLFVILVCFGINVFASNVCQVLDVNGNKTTDTIYVNVASSDKSTGTVVISFSSDSDKPVNANITIYVGKNLKYTGQVRVEPFMSGIKSFNVGAWSGSSDVSVNISSAKCLK
jgi:trimethylamine:corrinoid methyltransferase-like protein